MTKFRRLASLVALVLVAAFALPALAERKPQPEFRIGSEAPPLKVLKWVKGEPVEELKEGQVYVMEFWATWCGPCIQAMPHITEVAKKHEGKATVMGISIAERVPDRTDENILALVEPFVAKQGERMDYHVGVDGPEQEMDNTWFRAAGQRGIPCTFIIGKDKKIAWIGHPMRMDKVLEQVIEGTWDVKAAAAEQTKQWEHEQDLAEVMEPITAAMRARDYKGVAAAVDAAIVKLPETEAELRPIKFDALLRTDEDAAYAYMKECAKNKVFEKNPVEAYNFWIGMNRNAAMLKNPDWQALADIMEKALTGHEKSYTMLTAQADVYAKLSKFDKAVETQKKAIETATNNETKVPEAWLELQKRKLAEYEAKLQ
jgi:thiol-disulfide isomerase/thioredoxin